MGGKDSMFRYADGKDKLLMVLGTLGSVGDGMQYPITMFVLSHLINDFGKPGSGLSNDIVDKYALRLLYVAFGVGFSAFVGGFCWTRTAERQTSRMRMEYLKSVLRQEVGFFDTQETGSSTTFQVVSTISNDSNSIQVAICDKIPNCITFLSTFFFCLVVAFVLSWKLALAAIPLSIMFIIPCLVFGKFMMDVVMKTIESYAVAGGIAEQAISSIRTVYSYVGERQTLKKFSNALEKTLELGIKQGFAKGLMMGSMGIMYVGWAFQAFVGTYLVTEKGEKGGNIFVAGINVIMGGLSVLGALPNLTAITEAMVAATKIFEMIDRVPAIDSDDKKGKALSYVRGEIEFKDIYFIYPSRPDTPILQGLNLRIPAGKTVGLVGGSGSGKSTTIALLQRFYDPVEGEILLDGHKIRKLQLKWLRSHMGLVSQEPVLFATTIKENIMFGKEGATMDEVEAAAKAANAHEFITKLPEGYDTNVGQFGFQMSGGQKQRIAIARSLIRDPKILLLDEATSALDAQSERMVQEAIDKASRGRTTITIAHRLSTIRAAHLIVVFKAGRVIESGSHNELMEINDEEGGEYFRMVQLQQTALQNEASSDSNPTMDTRSFYKMFVAPSPLSVRSSAPSTPTFNPFSPALSMGTPYSYSIQTDPRDLSEEDYLEKLNQPSPSQWRLLKMNAPEWRRGLIGCLAAIGSGAVQPINAYCVGSLISIYFRTDKSEIKHKSRILSLVFLGIAVLNFTTSLLQHYNFAVMGERMTKRIREKLLQNLLTFEIGWFDDEENTSASICARLATEANIVRSLVGDRMSLLAQAIFGSIFAYALGLVLSWRLALVMIAVQPLVVGSYFSRSVLMKSMAVKAQKAQKEGSQLASEAVINHRTITAFSSQKRILGLFRATLRGPKEESVRHSWLSGFGLFSSQFLATAFTALAFWYGGRLLIKRLITPEHLFQAFLILLFTAYVIAEAGSMTNDISKGSNAIRSVFAILDRKSEIDPYQSYGQDKKETIKGRVDLRNVFFAYPARPDQMIFRGLNLKIDAGKTVALVGQSGSGKSTIIGLIERFYDPLNGVVFIDEKDVKSYNLRMLRSQIALVSQEPTLFAGTIRENIAYGKENAKESEIKKAAVIANAHEFISGMKDGYDTNCGERGVQLSGGQKQRVALARAILKNPSILLLDEATSALDSVSESLVQEALEKMMIGRTCIIVAHRLSTIQKSNSIAVIKNGKVAEQGSHNELISLGNNGAYYSLIKLQSGNSSYR
ncbi:Multidrug/pheromone exporter MDR family ABC transporter family [Tripterygium wilfordii]|uniref:Multidrug/pheromone exporter MDR family ABC transporter family n=1 Tax=Tripterygium wilfordii TaxID=458696 RepID=A0A7J7C2N1_TRIWF|nr:putative multidrug resistance protein [Tripterygium wilfordii]KAF5728373.1 Multidrug/pheromone exporter MDR family ABC transporter family [Tripterygium wilfordii]